MNKEDEIKDLVNEHEMLIAKTKLPPLSVGGYQNYATYIWKTIEELKKLNKR